MKLTQDHSEPIGQVSSSDDSTSGSSEADEAKRFLSGQTSADSFIPKLPTWFKSLILGLGVVMCSYALYCALWWPFLDAIQQPAVSSIVVREYKSATLPLPQFVSQSIDLINRGSEAEPITMDARERFDFDRFFRSSLKGKSPATRVLYVHAHGVSGQKTTRSATSAFLLPAHTALVDAAAGYPVHSMFTAFEMAECQNIFVVLNTADIGTNVRNGLIANQFTRDLQADFDAAIARWETEASLKHMTKKNIVVLYPCRQGQTALASFSLEASPFVLSTAYCLAGGPRANRLDLQGRPRPDVWISSREAADYVSATVANWSVEARSTEQHPLVLKWGDDFPLAEVDPNVTVKKVLQPPPKEVGKLGQALAKLDDATKDKSEGGSNADGKADGSQSPDTKPESSEDKSAATDSKTLAAETDADTPNPQQVESTEPPSRFELTSDQTELLTSLERAWARYGELEIAPIPAGRPVGLLAMRATIKRAEEALIVGHLVLAKRILKDDLQSQIAKLEKARPRDEQIPRPDGPNDEARALIDAALKSPTNDALKALKLVPLPESTLLLVLADHTRDDGAWHDAVVVRLAVNARRDARRVSSGTRPDVMRLIQADVDEIDHRRIQAELAVISGRYSAARPAFHQVRDDYAQVNARGETLTWGVEECRRIAVELPSLFEWLVSTGQSDRAARQQALKEFLGRYNDWSAAANAKSLVHLQTQMERLRGLIRADTTTAMRTADPVLARALLRTTLVPREIRSAMLRHLLTMEEPVPQRLTALPQSAAESQWATADAELLRTYLKAVAAISPELESAEFKDFNLAAWIAGTAPRPPSRQMATNIMQSFIASQQHSPRIIPPDLAAQDVFGWRVALVAGWQADAIHNLDGHDDQHRLLSTSSTHRLRRWMHNRAKREEDALPGARFGLWLNSLATQDKNGRSIADQSITQGLELKSGGEVFVTFGDAVTVPLVVVARRTIRENITADLVLESPAKSFGVQLKLSGSPAQADGLLRAPFENVIALQEYRFQLEVAAAKRDSTEPFSIPLTLRVSLSTGNNQFLPFRITCGPTKPQPAELVVEWEDRGMSRGRVDLLPNQAIPLTLAVKRNEPEIADLNLKFVSGNQVQSVDLASWEPGAGQRNVDPPARIATLIESGNVVIQLFSGDTLLDSRELNVAVLDPAQCFKADASFDVAKNAVSATISQVHFSDVDAPIPLELTELSLTARNDGSRNPEQPIQGDTSTTLKPDEPSAELSAAFSASARATQSFAISVADIPRAFRFALTGDRLIAAKRDSLSVSIQDSTEISKWKYQDGRSEFSLTAQVDGPVSTDVRAGIDLDRDGKLTTNEIQFEKTLWNGQQSSLQLVGTHEPAGWKLVSRVADLEVPINITGLTGRFQFLVEAAGNGKSAQASRIAYVLKDVPKIDFLQPVELSLAAEGQPLRVTLQADTTQAAAIEGIEFAFDKNKNGEIDTDEVVTPVGYAKTQKVQFNNQSRLFLDVPTEKLSGVVSLLARAHARVVPIPRANGEEEEDVSPDPKPSPESNSPAAPNPPKGEQLQGRIVSRTVRLTSRGVVTGKVVTTDGIAKPAALVLLGNANRTTTDANGNFRFSGVASGVYPIIVQTPQRQGRGRAVVRPAAITNLTINLLLK